MTVGCNARFTPLKWDRVKYLIGVHSKMVANISNREAWAMRGYHYFDMYAGPGFYADQIGGSLFGHHGSPLIAAGVLRSDPHSLFLNDGDPQVIASLTTTLAFENAKAHVTCLDASDFAEMVTQDDWRGGQFGTTSRKAMGLLFVDPNGCPNWDAVFRIADCRQYDRLDVLINVNSSIIKWCRVSSRHHETRTLYDYLGRLRKRYLYVWTPHKSNAHQFALVFATNWDKFPEFSKSKFYRSDTPEGREVFDRLNYTQKELCA